MLSLIMAVSPVPGTTAATIVISGAMPHMGFRARPTKLITVQIVTHEGVDAIHVVLAVWQ
jgi:hypothetical protein